MYGYIYKTTDKTNGKIYIGRHKSNKFEGLKYIGSGTIISNIKTKLIKENISIEKRFSVDLIDVADTEDELNRKEIYWITYYNSRDPNIGYNICKGGEAGPGGPMFLNHHHSEETRKEMSNNRKGSNNSNYGNRWNQSDDLKKLHSILSSGENNGMYGKHHTDETKLKIRNSKIGKPQSKTSNEQRSNTLKAYYCNLSDDDKHEKYEKASKSLKKYYKNKKHHSAGKIYVNNGIINKLISKQDLDYYLTIGFIKGKRKRKI